MQQIFFCFVIPTKKLTVHSHLPLLSSKWILGVAVVETKVGSLESMNGKPKMSLVALLLHRDLVLWTADVDTFRLGAVLPVIEWKRVGFNVTVEGDVGAERSTELKADKTICKIFQNKKVHSKDYPISSSGIHIWGVTEKSQRLITTLN